MCVTTVIGAVVRRPPNGAHCLLPPCYMRMTAESTLAARQGVAMSQHIPDRQTVDRLPRRRSDQVQRVVGWLLVLAGLLTVVLAVAAASGAYAGGLDRIKQDAATRTTVAGVLLDDAPPIGPG